MSFDNLNNVYNRKANLAVMIVFTIIALVITVFVPFFNLFGFAFLSIPSTTLMVSNRARDAIICAIAGIILLFFLNYIFATVLLVSVLAISYAYRYIVSRNKKTFFILMSVFFILILSTALFILIASIESKQNVVIEGLKQYHDYVENLGQEPILKNYQNLFLIDSNQFSVLIEQTKTILHYIPNILPSFLVVYFGAVSILNYFFSYLFFKRYGINLEQFVEFKDWDLPWFFCWGVICGIVLIIIPQFIKDFSKTFYTIGLNLIIVFGFIYLILGIAVLWGLFEKINFKSFWRYIVLIVIFFTPGFIILLPIFGLIDIWANFRKLKRI